MTATAVAMLAACTGCSAGKAKHAEENPEAAHLGQLGAWSEEYAKAHKNKPPKTLDQLKKWAESNKGAKEEDFVSTRDKQPYTLAMSGGHALIYETTGEDHTVYAVEQGASTASITSPESLQFRTMSKPPSFSDKPQNGPQGGPFGGHTP
jgi:hypothetical protein